MFKQGLCFPRHGAPHRWGAAVHLQPHTNTTTEWEGCKHPPDWSLRPGSLRRSLNYWYLSRVTLHVKNPEGPSDISLPRCRRNNTCNQRGGYPPGSRNASLNNPAASEAAVCCLIWKLIWQGFSFFFFSFSGCPLEYPLARGLKSGQKL